MLDPQFQQAVDIAYYTWWYFVLPVFVILTFRYICAMGHPGQWARAHIGHVPAVTLRPNYQSPLVNTAIIVLLCVRHPIWSAGQALARAGEWIARKYRDLRYNPYGDAFTNHLYWNLFWIIVGSVMLWVLFVSGRTYIKELLEKDEPMPWYDPRSIKIEVVDPILQRFNDPRAADDPPLWKTRQTEQHDELPIEPFTSEHIVPRTPEPEFPVQQRRRAARKSSSWDSEEGSSESSLVKKTMESTLEPEVAIPERHPVTSTSGTTSESEAKTQTQTPTITEREETEEERFERMWRAGLAVKTIKWEPSKATPPSNEGPWEPWKEDMAKNPNKRTWVGLDLTWCLVCQQYHCCEVPY